MNNLGIQFWLNDWDLFDIRAGKFFVTKPILTAGNLPTEHVFQFMAQENARPDEHASATRVYMYACAYVCIAWLD